MADNLKKGNRPSYGKTHGAGNGGRTRDFKLGKLVLYQLSYARLVVSNHFQFQNLIKKWKRTTPANAVGL